MEQMMRDVSDLINCAIESLFVRFGRFGEATQFPNELERRRADFFLGRRRREVVKGFDVSTHKNLSSGNCSHNKKRLSTFRDWIGQGSIGRFVRNVFATSEKAHERATLLCLMIAD